MIYDLYLLTRLESNIMRVEIKIYKSPYLFVNCRTNP